MGNFVSIILKSLNTGEEWKTTANVFEGPWDILHITGATDVKRVAMERPKKLGSLYYNYNVNNYVSRTIISINVSNDAKHCLTHFNIDQYGSGNESCVLKSSGTGAAFEGDLFNKSPPRGLTKDIPFSLEIIDCLFEIDKTICFSLCNDY